jgi:ribonucleotide monophosphatase NagD (HAD superfamily)
MKYTDGAALACSVAVAVMAAVNASSWAICLLILIVIALAAQILLLRRQLSSAVEYQDAHQLSAAEAHASSAATEGLPAHAALAPANPIRIGEGCGAVGSKWPLADIDAYLIDLDGTIYSPSGPIEGAAEFYASVLRHKPHVFLSNTGAKGADGVRSKLAKNGIIMGPASQHRHIYTAAQAQCRYMVDVVPAGARVFVIAGGNADGPGSYWMSLLRNEAPDLVASWCIRTHLTDPVAREWAAAAAAGMEVYVVLFSDGSISSVFDPTTGEAGFADWSYDVIKKVSFVLSHGAHLIATAEDAFNPSTDNLPLRKHEHEHAARETERASERARTPEPARAPVRMATHAQ